MRNATPGLDQFLDELARDARPGDRLPPIRDLMRRFGASQMVVQRAFQGLKARGLIASQVGRGTFFRAEGGPATVLAGPRAGTGANARSSPAVRSVLLLRRSISIVRTSPCLARPLLPITARSWASDCPVLVSMLRN